MILNTEYQQDKVNAQAKIFPSKSFYSEQKKTWHRERKYYD